MATACHSLRQIVMIVALSKRCLVSFLSGIPVSSQKPFMPFLNGILQKIIRLNELPNFLRSQSSGGTSLSEPMAEASSSRPAREHDHGFLWVQSPGNSSTDPWLMMINFGKWRAISNLLMLVRSSQLTPFSLHVDFGEFLAPIV